MLGCERVHVEENGGEEKEKEGRVKHGHCWFHSEFIMIFFYDFICFPFL
jgi:hypothetical protein